MSPYHIVNHMRVVVGCKSLDAESYHKSRWWSEEYETKAKMTKKLYTTPNPAARTNLEEMFALFPAEEAALIRRLPTFQGCFFSRPSDLG